MITPESQVKFLSNLQRLLAEGSFVATYKYALLLSIAELAVENGDDIGSELTISTKSIAEKFIAFYWRQASPFMAKNPDVEQSILLQNTGRQAAVISYILEARQQHGDSLACIQSDPSIWNRLVRKVDDTVRKMPLWRLQTVGSESFDFLYPNVGRGNSITLRPGIATCFRKFYGLIGDIVRGSWVRYVRRYNHELLGTTTDLTEFMFGSERSALTTVRDALIETTPNRCFYCDVSLTQKSTHVDHFIPWSRYPVDLGHNFVLAHTGCNSSKSDHIAAAEYLEKWVDRNLTIRKELEESFVSRGILSDLSTSARVAQWVYSNTADTGGMTWYRKDMIPLDDRWKPAIDRILQAA